MVAIFLTDIAFALDSIPAISGVTQQTDVVFTANAFALMKLRLMFFLYDDLLDRLISCPWVCNAGELSPPWTRAGGAALVAGRSGIERDQEMTARTRVGVSRFFMIGEETGCMSAMAVS